MTDNVERFIKKEISLIVDDDRESIIQLSDTIEENFSDSLNLDNDSYNSKINNLYDFWESCKNDKRQGVVWEVIFVDIDNSFNACRGFSAVERRKRTIAMTAKEILEDSSVQEISENELLGLFEV